MVALIARGRSLLSALSVALLTPCAFAAADPSRSPRSDRAPAGDPMMGMLIILGGIAFFIVLAWIFSRMGDDGGRGPDRTLL